MDKRGVYAFAVSLILVVSVVNVSAFNLIDWIKEALQKLKVTGNPVYEIPVDGLVSQYSFQQESYSGVAGEVADSAGNNHGITYGGVQVMASGIGGKSILLDGADDYVSFSNSYQGLNMSGKDMTISVWVNRTGAGYYDRIFTRYYNAGTFGGYALGITNTDKVWFFTGNGTASGWSYSNGNILPGAWYHIVVTQSGTNASLYIDGVKDVSWTKQRISGVAPTLTQIGGLKSALISFNGSIDELMIYNKALLASEVNSIYQNQKGRLGLSGGGSCISETNYTFCSRLGKTCDSVTGTDNCGATRTVTPCGMCVPPQTCAQGGCVGGGGGTITNRLFRFGDQIIVLRDSAVIDEIGRYVGTVGVGKIGTILSREPTSFSGVESPFIGLVSNYWGVEFDRNNRDITYGRNLNGYISEGDIEKSNLKKINQSDINYSLCYLELMIKEKKIKFNSGDYVKYIIDDMNAKGEIGVHVSPSINSLELKNFVEIGDIGIISSGLVEADGYTWYHADFFNERGADLGDGWAIQEQLEKIYKTESNSIRKFNIGDKIFTIAETNIKNNPSNSAANITTIDMFEYGNIKAPSRRFFWYENVGPRFADGKVWWKVNFNGIIGWVDEEYIEEVEKIEFGLENVNSIYGDYSHMVKQTYEGEESPYYTELYDSSDALISKHPLESSRIVFYDTFEDENPGGMIELDEGISEQIVVNSGIAKIKVDYADEKTEFNILPNDIQCKRTCGKENEIIDLTKREVCCDEYRMVNVAEDVWKCNYYGVDRMIDIEVI